MSDFMAAVSNLAANRGGDKAPRAESIEIPDPTDPRNPLGIIGGAIAIVYRDPASGDVFEHQFAGDGDPKSGAPRVAVQDGCVYLVSPTILLTERGIEDGEGNDDDEDDTDTDTDTDDDGNDGPPAGY